MPTTAPAKMDGASQGVDHASNSSDDTESLYMRTVRTPEVQTQRGSGSFHATESLVDPSASHSYLLLVSVEALLLYTVSAADARTKASKEQPTMTSSRSTTSAAASVGGSDAGSDGATRANNDQLFCATVPFAQITEVERRGSTIVLHYTPNVLHRMGKRDTVKQWLTGAARYTHRRATTHGAAPGQEAANRLDIACGSSREAASLAASVAAALERFGAAMAYLDTTMPPPDGATHVVAATLEPAGGEDKGGAGRQAVWMVAKRPAWGEQFVVPVREFTMSRRPAALHLYLHTPLGPACATIAPGALRTALAASQHEDAVLETLVPLGTVTEPHLWSDEAPGYLFEAAVRCRVVPHGGGGAAVPEPAGGGWRVVLRRLADGSPPDGPLLRTAAALLILLLSLAIQCAMLATPPAALLLLTTCAAAVALCCALLPALRACQQQPMDDADGARRLSASASRLLRPLETALWGAECVVLQLVDCEIRQRAAGQAAGPATPSLLHGTSKQRLVASTEMPDMSVMHGLNLSSDVQEQAARTPWLTQDMVQRFMDACRGDEHKALQRIKATVDWRLENDVDSVLERPHPHFDTFKRAYRHGVHCRALDGQPVFIEVVGGFKAAYQAFKDAGAPEDAGILHSVYINEWMVKDTTPEALPRGKCYKIVDAKGLGLSDFRHPAMTFARQSGAVIQENYVERLEVAVVVNVPAWFSIAWRIACSIMDERTTARFRICSTIQLTGPPWSPGSPITPSFQEARAVMLTFMREEDIPVAYGGPCTRDLYDSEDETKLREHVYRVNAAGS